MATVYVGSARSDENGAAHSGKAGDQKSGREVSAQAWYRHSKGWRVFRAKEPETAEKIARCMRAACDNDNIGYDQWQRHTLYARAAKVGFDAGRVTAPCETDCSALVRVCCAYAGITGLPESFRTGNMPANLMATGRFVELTGSKYTDQPMYLGAGDILVTRVSGHTVVALSHGEAYEGVAAPGEYAPGERILRNGDEGADVKIMQQNLIALGCDLGRWGADGDFGDATALAVMAFQRDHGCAVDAEYGPESHAAMLRALETLPSEGKQVRVQGGDCWVREAPGLDGRKLGVAHEGDTLPGNGSEENGWLPVLFKGGAGWVSGKYGRWLNG